MTRAGPRRTGRRTCARQSPRRDCTWSPGSQGEDSWELTLRLTGIGRGERLSVPAGRIRRGAEPNRLELVGGLVTEWFVNDARGLEHGFDLEARPGQAGDTAPVVLELAVGGRRFRDPEIEDRGLRASFRSRGGSPAVVYRDLTVIDALGRNLPATHAGRREPAENRDRRHAAVYPVVVDPLITQPRLVVRFGPDQFASPGSAAPSRVGG